MKLGKHVQSTRRCIERGKQNNKRKEKKGNEMTVFEYRTIVGRWGKGKGKASFFRLSKTPPFFLLV
jgi:hypothetical protein